MTNGVFSQTICPLWLQRPFLKGDRQYMLILPACFLEFFAMMLPVAVLPKLEYEYFGNKAVMVAGVVSGVSAFLSFFSQPVMGAISDKVGRKWLIFVASAFTMLPSMTLAFHNNLILYNVLHCICGAFHVNMALMHSYIADCTSVADRAKRMGSFMATFGLVMIFTPGLGAVINARLGRTFLFGAVIIIEVINLLYLGLFLPESHVHGTFSFAQSFRALTRKDILPVAPFKLILSGRLLRHLAVISLLSNFALTGWYTTMLLYTTQTLSFTGTDTGIYLGVFGVAAFLANAVGVRFLNPLLGERQLIMLALVFSTIQIVVFGVATNRSLAIVSASLALFTSLAGPAGQALASAAVTPDEQGKMMGAFGAIAALCKILSPIVFGSAVGACAGTAMPGLPYVVSAVLYVLAILFASRLPARTTDVASAYDSEPAGSYMAMEDVVGLESAEEMDHDGSGSAPGDMAADCSAAPDDDDDAEKSLLP